MNPLDPIPEIDSVVSTVRWADGRSFVVSAKREDRARPFFLPSHLSATLRLRDADDVDAFRILETIVSAPKRAVEFKVETNGEAMVYDTSDDTLVDPRSGDAVAAAVYAWQCFARAKDPVDQANAVVALSNAMFDLGTWLPEGWQEDEES